MMPEEVEDSLLDESASGSDGGSGDGWEDVGVVVETHGKSSLSSLVGEVIVGSTISGPVVASSMGSADTLQTAGDAYERDYYSLSTFVNYSEVYATFVSCLTSESTRLNISLDENFWLSYVYQTLHPLPLAPESTNLTSSDTNTSSILNNNINNYWWGDVGGGLGEGGEAIVADIMEPCLALTSVLATPRPYLLAWWQQFLWTLVFGTMMAMAVGGNMLVMWIIWAHRRMRTVTNYFLLNLSTSDLFMSLLNCMFNFIYMLHSDWPFGGVYCTISNFMANVTIAASVFTLMAISFDRYIAIVRPLEPRMSKTTARITIAVVWSSSMLLALPCLLYSTTVSVTYKDDEVRRGCILRWPDGQTSSSRQEYIYNIVFFITTYLLPMVVMVVCYYLIGRELWGSRSIGELTDRQVTSIKSKRRVVKMFIVIVIMFGVCWLPQQAFFLYTFHDARVLDTAHIQHVYLAFYWLAMANSMINPVIYYWMNARFRSYIREVVLGCVCLRCPRRRLSSYDGSPIPTRRNLNTNHHHHHHHHHPTGDDPSSRSRSDTRQGVNGTVRTFHGSRSNNHILVYSSRERLNIRNGRLVSGGGGGSGNSGGGGSGGGGQCDMCLQTLRPTVLNDVGGGVGGGRGLDHTTTPGPNNLPLRTLNNHFQSPMTDLYKYRAVKYQSEF